MLSNGEILPTGALTLSAGHTGAVNGWGVFSTLRVHRGVLFAWERHYARMMKDAALLHVPMPWTSEEMREQLLRLVAANGALESTLRVIVLRNQGGMWQGPAAAERPAELVAFTTDLKDWGTGVRLGMVEQARHGKNQFAGTKMLSWSFNLCMLEAAQRRGYDEVVLLNEVGEVSELTSANLFAVFGEEVVTPPLEGSGCLPGVTRAIVLEELRVPGVTVREGVLRPEDLERADGVFITSSTRDLLPVVEVEGLRIGQDRRVRDVLAAAFQEYLGRYCEMSLVRG